MIPRRFLLSTIVLASFATACTAIVLGKVGDTEDYKTVPTGSPSSAAGGLDECSLLKGDNYGGDRDANACSTCIQTNCASDITYACNAGTGKSPKPWFNKLRDCAQDPWKGEKPPSEPSSSSGYRCGPYETPLDEISDNGSDTEREPLAHNCVHSNCLQGALPACKMCEVHIRKPSSDDDALLRDDRCGKCLVASCQAELVRCCNTAAIDDFVKPCAFTAAPANKAACLELGKAEPDAGAFNRSGYDDAGSQCLDAISTCFKENCAGQPECK